MTFRSYMRAPLAALILCVCAIAPASAHPRHHYRRHRHVAVRHLVGAGQILPHPAGCPPIEFCGCGAADEIFGRPIRRLWLAANWLLFPRTRPAPGMAAVFGRHHVAVIREVYGDGTALLFDANSGHHLTRLHRVSIRYATIVDPHGRPL